jgi:hypothetical protein
MIMMEKLKGGEADCWWNLGGLFLVVEQGSKTVVAKWVGTRSGIFD